LLALLGVCPSSSEALILINEILADPPTGLAGDANQDGSSSSSADEFIELYNNEEVAVDLTGWAIRDDVRIRHIFPSATVMPAKSLLVIFGGGAPAIASPWQIASTGTLSLNNRGDTIDLMDNHGASLSRIIYGVEADEGQSLVRSQEGTGSTFILHTQLPGANGRLYSAGYFVSGVGEQSNPVPELPTWGYVLPMLIILWRKNRYLSAIG